MTLPSVLLRYFRAPPSFLRGGIFSKRLLQLTIGAANEDLAEVALEFRQQAVRKPEIDGIAESTGKLMEASAAKPIASDMTFTRTTGLLVTRNPISCMAVSCLPKRLSQIVNHRDGGDAPHPRWTRGGHPSWRLKLAGPSSSRSMEAVTNSSSPLLLSRLRAEGPRSLSTTDCSHRHMRKSSGKWLKNAGIAQNKGLSGS